MATRVLSRSPGRLTFWLGVLVTAGFFWVNIMGFVDTETGSALGCGHNWPLCNGNVIPSVWGLHTLIEFLHRAIVGVVVMLLVAFAALALWNFHRWVEIRLLVGLAFIFTLLQSFLGALGVLLPVDPPAVLATHLGVSLLAFNSVFLTTVVIAQIRRQHKAGSPDGVLRTDLPDRRVARWTWFTLGYTVVAMYVGAFVSSTGDGGMFQGWPLPTEQYGVVGNVLVVDVLHRSFAAGLLLLTIHLARLAYRIREARPELFRATVLLLILVGLQAISGMTLILTHLALAAFLSHVTIVSCLFATLCYLALQVVAEPHRKSVDQRTRALRKRTHRSAALNK